MRFKKYNLEIRGWGNGKKVWCLIAALTLASRPTASWPLHPSGLEFPETQKESG